MLKSAYLAHIDQGVAPAMFDAVVPPVVSARKLAQQSQTTAIAANASKEQLRNFSDDNDSPVDYEESQVSSVVSSVVYDEHGNKIEPSHRS